MCAVGSFCIHRPLLSAMALDLYSRAACALIATPPLFSPVVNQSMTREPLQFVPANESQFNGGQVKAPCLYGFLLYARHKYNHSPNNIMDETKSYSAL